MYLILQNLVIHSYILSPLLKISIALNLSDTSKIRILASNSSHLLYKYTEVTHLHCSLSTDQHAVSRSTNTIIFTDVVQPIFFETLSPCISEPSLGKLVALSTN
jgi:hypothetical protein